MRFQQEGMAGELSLSTLDQLPPEIEQPRVDPRSLGIGIVHLGLGNFHRAHQAVFTEEAVAHAGGDWGITGVSLRTPGAPHALRPQDNLYTVETLGDERGYRVIGVLRKSLFASDHADKIADDLSSATTRMVTLTITEKGYCLDSEGALAFDHPDIRHDLAHLKAPISAIGWLIRGFDKRRRDGAGPISVVSCDNLSDNGGKLERAVGAFAHAIDTSLAAWIEDHVSFPRTMVDCIVPATDAACRSRVDAALGVHDEAPVMREIFAQWVIEDRFAGPRPLWESAGAEIVADVAPFEKLKLHVLNTAHSALAYMGLPRGHRFVREAVVDAGLSDFVAAMVEDEIAPALAPLDVGSYWRAVRVRFANRFLDHRLEQIAEDGSAKLAQRIFPLLIANVRNGRPHRRLAQVIRAWLEFVKRGDVKDPASAWLRAWAASGGRLEDAIDDPALFPDPFRTEKDVRVAMLEKI
jgi:fructuronate reductase